MKIVINGCFGGFGLSRECFIKLFERGAKIISKIPFTESTICNARPNGKSWPDDEYIPAEEPGWYIHKTFGRLSADCGVYAPIGTDAIYCTTDTAETSRTDPDLIALIEEKGSKWASGFCAELEVVEIPDDVEWVIEEYDGNEHVAEKHRTWN